MLSVPLKCKLCHATIRPPAIVPIIGSNHTPTEEGNAVNAILAHVLEMRHKENGKGKHSQALDQVTLQCQSIHTALMLGCFEITPEMEKARQEVFARVHALTRTVRMSDEELRTLYEKDCAERGIRVSHEAFDFACDLRDRYESLGKYAPVNASAPAAQEESHANRNV